MLVKVNIFIKSKKRSILKKNIKKRTIHFAEEKADSSLTYSKSHEYLSVDDLNDYLKPQPNYWFKLFVFNRIDSTKMNQQIQRKKEKTALVNRKKIDKQNAVNRKRHDKAKAKGEEHYFQKVKKLKKEKPGWRHWVVNTIGDPPVIMDSTKVQRSAEQLSQLLKNKGFYENQVDVGITYKPRRRKSLRELHHYFGRTI